MRPTFANIDTCIAALMEGEQIKVWSFIMTIFGDMAAEKDTAQVDLRGQVLSRLTENVGIKPEAMRVALHRLRKDHWIVARKDGRTSQYRLSPDRLAETRAAAKRIYAAKVAAQDVWTLTVRDPANTSALDHQDAIILGANVTLGRSMGRRVAGEIVTQVAHADLPDWARDAALDSDWNADCAVLADLFAQINATLAGLAAPTPEQSATLRLLAVHRWRRLILRVTPVAEEIQSADWIGHRARLEFTALLSRLPHVTKDDLLHAP